MRSYMETPIEELEQIVREHGTVRVVLAEIREELEFRRGGDASRERLPVTRS
jgi:hypothetical protein